MTYSLFKKSFPIFLLTVTLCSVSSLSFSAPNKTSPPPQAKQLVIQPSVNINSATAEKIASTLKGIGLKKAQAIVEWRKANGKFTKIEQLMEIKGIGEKTLTRNKKAIIL